MSEPITCTCGHALSSHRQDPEDPYVTERCVTCGCAAFLNRDEEKMQSRDDEDPTPEAVHPLSVVTATQERIARTLLAEASKEPGLTPCDDAWQSAAIFAALLDAARTPDPDVTD